MDYRALSELQWFLSILAAFVVGFSKAGFGGLGMLSVILLAGAMRGHEMESTGTLLPMLIMGDLLAASAFRRNVDWKLLIMLLPPAVLGVVLGTLWMGAMSNQNFRPIIGGLVLALACFHLYRKVHPSFLQVPPHSKPFAWGAGILAGVTTMLANAAGPVMNLYLLAMRLGKMELVSTAAWYFLIVNLIKVPFSAGLGLISVESLRFNLLLFPAVVAGIIVGKRLLHTINQQWFERILFTLICLSALYLMTTF